MNCENRSVNRNYGLVVPNQFHGEWNYTIKPQKPTPSSLNTLFINESWKRVIPSSPSIPKKELVGSFKARNDNGFERSAD